MSKHKKGIKEKAWEFVAKRMVRNVDQRPAEAEMSKPLSDAKVAFITTAGVHLKSQSPFDTDGDYSFREIPGDTKEEDLMITHTHYDHADADQDLDVVFPLAMLRGLASRGVIGSVAARHYGMMGYMPQVNRLVTGAGPEMAQNLVDDGVDICLLSPG